MKTIIAAVLLVTVASPAIAARSYDSYDSYDNKSRASRGYIGIAAGKNTIAADDTTTWVASTASTLFGGYTFNNYVAVEAAYTSLGSADTDPVSFPATGSVTSLSAVGSLPLGRIFSLYAKLGYAQSKLEIVDLSFSETNSGAIYGVGAQFNVGQRVGIRVGYDKFKVGSTTPVDSSLVSVGALFKF